MKTFTKTLYKKAYKCYAAWSNDESLELIMSYVWLDMHFDFKKGLRFSCSVPNYSCCYRSPFKALFDVLEHESIGMSKYTRLKERVKQIGCWERL